jgi:acyl carrier protein
MTDELAVSSAALEQAIARRVAHLHDGESIAPAAIDCEASFFATTGFCIGPHVLDSLDIVEMLTALEVDFNVDIITSYGVEQYDSIAKVTSLLERIVDASELAAFEGRWSE